MKPKFLCYILAGYGPETKSCCFTGGWSINLETRRGRFVLWSIDTIRAIRGKPRDFKWWLADLCSRAALRLRGDATPRLFGWYEDIRGNRAAEIDDNVTMDLVMATNNDDPDHVERMNRIHEQVRELAALARAAMLVQCRSIADAHVTAAFLATRSFTVIADSNNALVLEVRGPQPSTTQTF